MRGDPQRLERIVGVVLRIGTTTSAVSLAIGLALSFVPQAAVASRLLLHTGVLVLLCTPVARVVASVVEYAAERDWLFVSLTLTVLLELLASAVAAFR